MSKRDALLKAVENLYTQIDQDVQTHVDPDNDCRQSGACCNFAVYGHRLYVTTPEVIYFADRLGTDSLQPMLDGTCPYMKDRRCTAYAARFSGCRIFGCRRDADLQSTWSEDALQHLKELCLEYDLEYHYTDLATALNNWGPAAVRWAGEFPEAREDPRT
jgi:Fe-S-cluster containining protein